MCISFTFHSDMKPCDTKRQVKTQKLIMIQKQD